MLFPDCIFPVPAAVSRRAWECAHELAAEHSSAVGDPAAWQWLLSMVGRDPVQVTWAECAALFRMHRQFRPVQA